MDISEILIGQLPEALYFALFMIFAKRLDSKRITFCVIMMLDYILLLKAFPFSIWSRILYVATSFILLKILYGKRAQITDVFTMGIASIGIMIVSLLSYLLFTFVTKDYILTGILNKLVLFDLLFIFKDKLYNIQLLYKKFWNRNDKIKKPMKSITFRCLNLVIFDVMFYVIHLGILFCIWFNNK